MGFFTAEQLEEKHRAMLARAAQNAAVPDIRSAVEAVHITIFDVDTGIETVEMGISKVSMDGTRYPCAGERRLIRDGALRFQEVSRHASPQDAFKQYLASPDGIATFGKATAVQLFAIDVDAVKDLAKG